MRAAVCRRYGPPEVVNVEEWPDPQVGPGQVRVRVAAAAVNFPDALLVADRYQVSVPVPFVPGSEFAGVVAAVGADVGEAPDDVAVGDRVRGTTLVGAFAEQVVVDASVLRVVSDGIDLAVAAASGVAHSTAHHVLRSVARVEEGERVVVLGAGGGVGMAAVQLAVAMGAEVTAVASSPEKLAVAADEGAAVVIDHRAEGLREALRAHHPAGTDVVVDPVGGALAEPAFRSLRWGGRFVTVGYASGKIPAIPLNLVLLKGATIAGFEFASFVVNEPEEFARGEVELADLLGAGRVVPVVGATFPLTEAAAALAHVAGGRSVGKTVIRVR